MSISIYKKPNSVFELTVTVTQIANNWKEMNELTETVTQKN